MWMLNVLFLELIICIFYFFKKLKHAILFKHVCLFQNSLIDLLTRKGSHFIWINIELFCIKHQMWGFKTLKQTHFSQDVLIIGCNIFAQVMVICLSSWDFDIYYLTFRAKSVQECYILTSGTSYSKL